MHAHDRFTLSLPHYGLPTHHTPAIGSIYSSASGLNVETLDYYAQRNEDVSKLSHALAAASAEIATTPPPLRNSYTA